MIENDTLTAWEERPSRYTLFMCGVMAGVALGMLTAPARGRDTRRRIASSMHDGRERASQFLERTRQAARRRRRQGVGLVEQARAAPDVRADIAGIVEEARSALERAKHSPAG